MRDLDHGQAEKRSFTGQKQFDDTDYMELKAIRKGLEKEASKLAKSEAIIYSLSGVFMSNNTCVTKQPSNSTFLNSEGDEAKIESLEGDIYSIIAPSIRKSIISVLNLVYKIQQKAVDSYVCNLNQVIANLKLFADITTTSDKTIEIDVSYYAVCCGYLLDSLATLKIDKKIEIDVSYYAVCCGYLLDSLATLKIDKKIEPKNAAAEERSKHESTRIKLYRNVIRNETCRMMASIDMVKAEAEHLFGHERTRIFLDLLDNELFQFGPTGATSNIANMAESTVRQHVISFFELACDMMNRLKTLLLGCPDSKRLQQMPEQNFISLMQSVIDSPLKTKAKGGKRLSSKGSTLIMVDSEEFERVLGEEIPENILDRLRRGDEMVVHRFVDTRLERTQASERRENRTIYSIYFPSDRHLSIYIRTENGSYWHQSDMQRASRINM